jgi:GNAT superfamily N-acetyltransferase
VQQASVNLSHLPPLADGVAELPPGRIACMVTFMQHFGPPPAAPLPSAGVALATQAPASVADYLGLYRRVGADFLWMSRLVMPERELAEWLARSTTLVRFATRGGTPVGLIELDRSTRGETEIVSFGVVPEETGTGLSRFMMQTLLADEFARGAARVWLHTCTFDHPAAIPFYRRNGFRAYRFAVEIAEDPRLTGHLPRDAAPHVPLIDRD